MQKIDIEIKREGDSFKIITNSVLLPIAEAMLFFRLPFFIAGTKQEAQNSLVNEPLEQHEIATFCKVHKSTISRQAKKTVMTPHGLYLVGELFKRHIQTKIVDTHTQENKITKSKISVAKIESWIEKIVHDYNTQEKIYSYEDVRQTLYKKHGVDYSAKSNMVAKICRKLKIGPNKNIKANSK